MVRAHFNFLVLGVVMFLICSVSSADVPHMINYQGKLTTDTGGGCLNDTVQMRFSIYPDTLGSPAVWTETQNNVIVKEGIFNVLLGGVVSIPDSVFDGSVKFLGVKVESDPEMRPLKAMVSVPYAYRAKNADNMVPRGVIVMWSGSLSQIPNGWVLCDGNNGTPDLRDRFIYGWTDGVNPGGTGGATSHSHTVNPHSHSAQIWAQYYWQAYSWHQFGAQNVNVADPPWGGHYGVDIYNNADWTQQTLYELSSPGATREEYKDMLGVNGNTGNASPGTSSENHLPPYYKLAFIMKL
jgi:hypothetical protein